MYSDSNFIATIQEGYNQHLIHGPRKPERLISIQNYIGQCLSEILGDGYEVIYGRRSVVNGLYADKDVPFLIKKDNIPVLAIGSKFITSNFRQNAGNYLEGLLGVAANIQSTNMKYANFIIIQKNTPYFDEDNVLKRYEELKQEDILKYIRLAEQVTEAHSPFATGIMIVDINHPNHNVSQANMSDRFTQDFANLYSANLTMSNFFQKISDFRDSLNV